MNLTVDVISDVICPWCYIGKRRMEKAIAEFGKPVEVRWHPFQLNPKGDNARLHQIPVRTENSAAQIRHLCRICPTH